MPSPVAHSLIGLGLGAFAWLPRLPLRALGAWVVRHRWQGLGVLALANAPDIDYLPGGLLQGDFNALHHGISHSVGWCLLVAAGVWCAGRGLGARWGLRALLLQAGVICSHLLADWVTDDARPPIGIPLWWPLDAHYRLAPVTLFWRLQKRDWSDVLQWHNAQAVGVELAWCVPLLVLVIAWKTRARHREPSSHALS